MLHPYHILMPKPTVIQISKSRRVLIIPWDDGHQSEYPWDGLRLACPCAECKGGHENMGAPPDPTVFDLTPTQSYELIGADLVGNYALQPLWADGHRYGLYTWEYLRGLCPCEECRGKMK
ncbi:MAG TPA: DUF971 domain-containing protein [Anaerolineales bacterium]|nr:DUF971 domain-containing protein [Anaerolineales bacterium]